MPSVTSAPINIDPSHQVDDEINTSHYCGPFAIGANLYMVLQNFTSSRLSIYKSTDSGLTWVLKDDAHSVNTNNNFDVVQVGGVFQILYVTNATFILRMIAFDTATDTYGAVSADGPAAGNLSSPAIRIARFSGGDFCVAYFDTSLPGFGLVVFSAGVWGAPTTFIANLSMTGLVIGPDDIARFFYYQKTFPGLNCFFRTYTHAGVLGAQQAVFSSTFLANTGVETPPPFPVGRILIWNNKLILPYYGNPAGSGKQAGIYIGDPYTAPVWSFLLADTLVWAGTAADGYGYILIDSSNNLILFWIVIDTPNNISRIYYAINSGAGFAAPVFFYDQVTNPPPPSLGTFAPPVHKISGVLFASGHFGVLTSMEETIAGIRFCIGFYMTDAGITPPPPPPVPPSPPTFWNPGSAVSLLCEKNYPWLLPPLDRIPVSIRNSIPSPAANIVTEIWNYTVPDGMWFVFDTLLLQATVAGYVPGSGSLTFTLDVNTPTTGPALPVARPLAKFTTDVGELSEPVHGAPVQLYQGDILRAKVLITDNTLGVGLPNVIHAVVEGWLFPHSRNI